MTSESAVVDLGLPVDHTATGRGIDLLAVLRRLARRPRRLHERPYLTIGDSYRIPDRRRGHPDAVTWIYTHH